MARKFKLSLAIATIILVFSLWLSWRVGILGWMNQLAQGIAVSIIVTTLLKEKTTKLAGLTVKGFVLSYVLTTIIWLVTGGFMAVYLSLYFGPWLFLPFLVYDIPPRALLPVAISVVVYGVTKIKLKPWEILLSTWYILIFVVHAAYDVWWLLFVQPYVQHYYSSGAGAIALDMLLTFLAFLIACALTIIYPIIRKPLNES